MRTTTIMLAAASLLFAACGDSDTEPAGDTGTIPPPSDPSGSDGLDGDWILVAASAGGEPLDLVDGYDVTLSFDGDRIGGTAACNGYGGTIDVDEAPLVRDLSWTEMGCEPDVTALEQAYLSALGASTQITIDDDGASLSMFGPGSRWYFEPLAPVLDADIVGTTWVLDTYIDGDAATNMPMMDLAMLTFEPDGTVAGSTSCRRLIGEWVTAGATVQLTSFTAVDDPTAGVCAPEAERLDGLIISVLEAGFTVEVEGNRMTLMAPGNEGLSYTAG